VLEARQQEARIIDKKRTLPCLRHFDSFLNFLPTTNVVG
jgi:hypothetical protein